jgi:hypothetical protein
MFFTNVFRFSSRKAVAEHAYVGTRKQLLERREEIEPLLERSGIRYRDEILQDPDRDLWKGVGVGEPGPTAPVGEELDNALTRLEFLLERMESAELVPDR